MDREDLRLAVYRSFAESGRAPTPAELASQFGTDVPAVSRGLKELAASRDLVLDGQGRIVMAHPFSAIPLGFSVMGARVLLWGGCACYSFALPLAEPACSARTGATAESAPRAVQIADRGLWWLEWRMTGSRRLSHRY